MELSKTEFEVCAYTASGFEAKEIARKMYRSYHTIAGHIKKARLKNGLKNVAEITREFVLAHGDPRQYIKTLLLVLQFSITLTAMDADFRKPTRTRTRTRTQKDIRC